jgi:hypothetical protein
MRTALTDPEVRDGGDPAEPASPIKIGVMPDLKKIIDTILVPTAVQPLRRRQPPRSFLSPRRKREPVGPGSERPK